MKKIVLATINAKYIHPSLALRSLFANLGSLQSDATILELPKEKTDEQLVEILLGEQPSIVGLSVAIWNVERLTSLARLLKSRAPQVRLVLGGPEVSHEFEGTPLFELADHLIRGEGEIAFRGLCEALLTPSSPPPPKVLAPQPPELATLVAPYALYTEDDLAHRMTYVEASRGCPFGCQFCLSSLDKSVRAFPLAPFLHEMGMLLARGARRFKFIDRTFNLDPGTAAAILRFFLERRTPDLFLHFEVVPDRLPEEILELARQFPAGMLQFEIGIQTFNPEVARRIRRNQNYPKTARNIEWLRAHTAVHLHADLIAGLPGEDLASFASGFDQLLALGPQEIQVGILKRLRGAPIDQHTSGFHMRYSSAPPYEVLETSVLSADLLERLRRFAQYWERFYNCGEFRTSLPRLWATASPFQAFSAFSKWIHSEAGVSHGLPLEMRAELLFRYLTEVRGENREEAREHVLADYLRPGGRKVPRFARTPHP